MSPPQAASTPATRAASTGPLRCRPRGTPAPEALAAGVPAALPRRVRLTLRTGRQVPLRTAPARLLPQVASPTDARRGRHSALESHGARLATSRAASRTPNDVDTEGLTGGLRPWVLDIPTYVRATRVARVPGGRRTRGGLASCPCPSRGSGESSTAGRAHSANGSSTFTLVPVPSGLSSQMRPPSVSTRSLRPAGQTGERGDESALGERDRVNATRSHAVRRARRRGLRPAHHQAARSRRSRSGSLKSNAHAKESAT